MPKDNHFFEDFTKLAGNAMGVAMQSASEMKTQMEKMIQQQLEHLLQKMRLVQREEFEAVKTMAVKAREENEVLKARLAALEASLGGKKPAPKKPSGKKA